MSLKNDTTSIVRRTVHEQITNKDDIYENNSVGVEVEAQMLQTSSQTPEPEQSLGKSDIMKYRDKANLVKKAALLFTIICCCVYSTGRWLNMPPPTLKQIYKARRCDSYHTQTNVNGERTDSKSLPIYTEEQWARMRKVWRDQGHINPYENVPLGDRRRRSEVPQDFVPPFQAGQTRDGKGRGIFATRDIKRGEMTYGGASNYIFFHNGGDYRKYLNAFDDQTACDIMKFVWPQRGAGFDRETVIVGVMDDNSLQNDGGKERANTGCHPEQGCHFYDEYALRDIKKGEEILCNYGSFFSLDFLNFELWKEFGL